MTDKNFHYAVGRLWHPKDPNSQVAFYAYGSGEVFHGTLAAAEGFKNYCNKQRNLDDVVEGGYEIYKVVKLTEEEMATLREQT